MTAPHGEDHVIESHKVLQPVERTHTEEVHGELSSMGGHPW